MMQREPTATKRETIAFLSQNYQCLFELISAVVRDNYIYDIVGFKKLCIQLDIRIRRRYKRSNTQYVQYLEKITHEDIISS